MSYILTTFSTFSYTFESLIRLVSFRIADSIPEFGFWHGWCFFVFAENGRVGKKLSNMVIIHIAKFAYYP